MAKRSLFDKYKLFLTQARVNQEKKSVSNFINDVFEFRLKDLSFKYKGQNKFVLNNFSASLQNGKVYCILGANGAGKSTLFKLLLNLLPLQVGDISFKSNTVDLNLKDLNVRERAKIISYVPQEEASSFMYKTEDVVLMSSFAQHGSAFFSPKESDEEKVQKLMERLGIGHLIGKYYPLLSGGERQLVRIARALYQECPILLMDEPTTGLDYGFQMKILTWAKNLARQGYMVIFTSHNPQLASVFSDEILLLNEGAIMETQKGEPVLSKESLAKIYAYDFEFYPILEEWMIALLSEDVNNEFGLAYSCRTDPNRSGEKPSRDFKNLNFDFDNWLKEWFKINCNNKYASILPNLEVLKDNKFKGE